MHLWPGACSAQSAKEWVPLQPETWELDMNGVPGTCFGSPSEAYQPTPAPPLELRVPWGWCCWPTVQLC